MTLLTVLPRLRTNNLKGLGATLTTNLKPTAIYDAFMNGPEGTELFHGYTYSGHPLACAAGLAVLDAFAEDGVLANARETAAYRARNLCLLARLTRENPGEGP